MSSEKSHQIVEVGDEETRNQFLNELDAQAKLAESMSILNKKKNTKSKTDSADFELNKIKQMQEED